MIAVCAVVAPWTIRNYLVFHKFIPLRDNAGFELYCGNNKDSWHWGPPGYHPSDNEEEWREFQELGEPQYVARKGEQAMVFIRAHRELYVEMTLRRIVYIWAGFWSFEARYLREEPFDLANIVFCSGLTLLGFVGLRRAYQENANRTIPYLLVLLLFPLVYYFTHPEDYHRRPIDPMIVALAAYGVTSWRRAKAKAGEPAGKMAPENGLGSLDSDG